MRIDFHSHILPAMDDGAESVTESLELLNMLKKDGVGKVIATPHFYPHRENIDSFLKRRELCYKTLTNAVKGKDLPEIVLGAEVYFTQGIENAPPKDLRIADTDFLLLELPYTLLTPEIIQSVKDFIRDNADIKMIFAHIERYFDYSPADRINKVLSFGLIAQGNCDSTRFPGTRRHFINLIKNGVIQLLGTDLHSLRHRPPRFGNAESYIRNQLSDDIFEGMMTAAQSVLENKSADTIKADFKNITEKYRFN